MDNDKKPDAIPYVKAGKRNAISRSRGKQKKLVILVVEEKSDHDPLKEGEKRQNNNLFIERRPSWLIPILTQEVVFFLKDWVEAERDEGALLSGLAAHAQLHLSGGRSTDFVGRQVLDGVHENLKDSRTEGIL